MSSIGVILKAIDTKRFKQKYHFSIEIKCHNMMLWIRLTRQIIYIIIIGLPPPLGTRHIVLQKDILMGQFKPQCAWDLNQGPQDGRRRPVSS